MVGNSSLHRLARLRMLPEPQMPQELCATERERERERERECVCVCTVHHGQTAVYQYSRAHPNTMLDGVRPGARGVGSANVPSPKQSKECVSMENFSLL